MKQKLSFTFMIMGTLFSVLLILSNLLEIKVIEIGGLPITGGLLVFPLSYVINDCITEVWGFKRARMVIWSAFAMNFLVMLFLALAVALPAAPYWEGSDHFDYVYNLAPRIVFASLCAFLAGSFLNAYVISKMKILQKGKGFSLRAIVSTIVGETADSAIFFPIAFGGLMSWRQLMVIALIQVGLKSLYEVIILPITVVVVKKLKRSEEV